MLRSFVCPCSSTAWVSRYFFLPFPTVWGYTACLVKPHLKATLINSSATSLPQTRKYIPSPRLAFPHLLSSQILTEKNFLPDIHSCCLSFLFPISQFYPFITNKYEKQSSCSWENVPQLLHSTAVMGKGLLLYSETMYWRSRLKFQSKQQLWVSLNTG